MNTNILARGTRIIEGDALQRFRAVTDSMAITAHHAGYSEIVLPAFEPLDNYAAAAKSDLRMFRFTDHGGREMVLRPEGTATLRLIAAERGAPDWRVYYLARCYRYDKPQKGRYREFFQFGVEWLNPTHPSVALDSVRTLARDLARKILSAGFDMVDSVDRGWAYATPGTGFEIHVPSLGTASQVCGGCAYDNGCGFAFGVERVVLALP